MQQQNSPEPTFVPNRLPWLVAGAAFLIYLLTLNHWFALDTLDQAPYSSNSLDIASSVCGWSWIPNLSMPLFWILTYPFRWLPTGVIPLALNVFAAACAALALAQLARSVAILPHDRTEEQRVRERAPKALLSISTAWAAPIFAVLVCGFQLSFWEHATVASAEMLNLLLFSFVIRAVLEYRLSGRQTWLSVAALVYGAGMANNWAMIAFFPLFLIALVWLRGLSFFNSQFLLRMFGWGSIGLLLYLVLPLATLFSNADITFWQALKFNLGNQKNMLFQLAWNKNVIFSTDMQLWILAVPSLLPLLLMGVRWPSYFGDPSRLGVALATFVFHLFHAFLLVVCLWVAFNPRFSPRNMLPGTPGLTLYYLNALCLGYFIGYFLLIFGRTAPPRIQSVLYYPPFVRTSVVGLIWALALASVAGLVYRNLPNIRLRNGSMVRDYANSMAQELPAAPATILSDDAQHLNLVRAKVAGTERGKNYFFLDSASLKFADYHKYLNSLRPDWPYDRNKGLPPILRDGTVDDGYKLQLLQACSRTSQVYYLHPSFGYYFEVFQAEPLGLVQQLTPITTNSPLIPRLPTDLVEKNEAFWKARKQTVDALIAATAPPRPMRDLRGADLLFAKLSLSPDPMVDALVLAREYSRAINNWAVQLQRNGDFKQAAGRFETALALNPNNVIAELNLESNRKLQAGTPGEMEPSKAIADRFKNYRDWNSLMGQNGPFDEANFCLEQARALAKNGLYRQAAQLYSRVIELAPNHVDSRIGLGEVEVLMNAPDKALELVRQLRSEPSRFDLKNRPAQLMTLESTAYMFKQDPDSAQKAIMDALAKNPDDDGMMDTGVGLFVRWRSFTNALKLLNRQIETAPNNRDALVNKGYVLLQLSNFDQAIPTLTRVINLETNSQTEANLHWAATMNRAIAYLQTGKLEEAKADYEALAKVFPDQFPIYYGLGEIAYRMEDYPGAIKSYRLYLSYAPTNTVEASNVVVRLKELEKRPR